MTERVPVRVVLLIGDQAEITADAPDAAAPERYSAASIAADAGVPLAELPGMKLTAAVGEHDRLRDFRRA